MVMKNYIWLGGTTFSRPRMGTTNVWNGVSQDAFNGKKTIVVNANSKKTKSAKKKTSSKKGK